jgi:hypothetical protein
MSWVGHVERVGKKRNAYRVLLWKAKGKTGLGSRRRKWKYIIKLDIKEIESCELDPVSQKINLLRNVTQGFRLGHIFWRDLAQVRDRWRALVNTVMNCGVPQNAGNCLTS